jgi:hypothetical protein
VLPLTLVAAASLTACGGGGSDTSTGTPSTSTKGISLQGVASKGLMANADVKVHPIRADGSVDTATVLASATTDATGRYTLSFDGTAAQPYVIRVSAKADGSTTHLDEVTGTAQPLPAGFAMRTLFMPAQTGTATASASITPFSEMAVSAAERATGGVTATNAAQAVSTVTQLLGFDPTTVTAKTADTASSDDEKKLAVMLAAVSKMAASDQLGCTTGSGGDKTTCVVGRLAASASSSTLKLSSAGGSTSGDVSSALTTALTSVLADSKLSGSLPSTALASVVSNLGCAATACTPATSGTTPAVDPVASGIAAARLLFTELKSDWTTLFSQGGASALASGAANVEAYKFRTAMTDIQVPVDVLAKDAGAMVLGIDLYNDFKSGRTTLNNRGRGEDMTSNDGSANFSTYTTAGCSLYTDTTNTTLATTPAAVASIGCRAAYYVSRTTTATAVVTTEWRHGFTIVPQVDGSYTYTSRARRRVTSCPIGGGTCATDANDALQADTSTGKVTVTLDAPQGSIRGFAVNGDLPGAFRKGSTTLFNHHHTIALTGTTTTAADGLTASSTSDTLSITGTLKTYADATTETGTLAIKRGQLAMSTAQLDNKAVGTLVDLDVAWSTPTAEFEGVLKLGDVVLTKPGTDYMPTRGVLSGALRTIASGTTTEFLKGTLTASLGGVANYDGRLADSTSNFVTGNLTFVGAVSAPGRPTLEFTIGTSMKSHEDEASQVNFQYRTLVAGTPRMVIAGSSSLAADGTRQFTLTEAANNLSMSWTGEPTTAKLMKGSTVIGAIDAGTKMLTFSDQSFLSLDMGL